ncbi:MAG: DNA mismatch repair endonuclease MutL [Promethearchaeota archaeon]
MKQSKIKKILDADKIAAGEVVERPANVVKELIENSIDAGAREIRIIVKQAGRSLVQVIDNGIGIPPDEVEFAFERHTSSKIRSIIDLNNLSTLGFRGEALASIAAVSQVEIISRTKSYDRGIQLIIEGGKSVAKKEISCPIGTNIKVKNLFYNIPARQKFLKKDSTELGHITDFIQRYSLAYPDLHFIYQHNDLTILNCPASNNLKTTTFHIYGKQIAKYMEKIDYSEEDKIFKIYGLIGHPQISKKNRNLSSLFLNRRYIISDNLFRAINEAYKGTLMINKHPFFILFLDLSPSTIDFNVHPKKLHVRFEREEYVYNKVYNIIRKFVEERFIEQEAKYISTELADFIPKMESQQIENQEVDTIIKIDDSIIEESVQLHITDHSSKGKNYKASIPETFLREKVITKENFPKLRLISSTGQLSNKTYVILEGFNENDEPGLYILDQHAASERIKKEKLLKSYESSKSSRQLLISPLKIDVSPSEKFFLEENLNQIKRLGFNFELFGGNTFILREIPIIMEKIPNVNVMKDIIADITEIGQEKSFSEVKEEIINYLACHKSIRGGDDLSLEGIRNLIIELADCKDSYHCAHGRPTLRFISYKELDKLFKRTA